MSIIQAACRPTQLEQGGRAYKQLPSDHHIGMGRFQITPILPGQALPTNSDHGYGPLARFDESRLEAGGIIPMHEHQNDEIITYMIDGALVHTDSAGSSFAVDARHIMVMNAGHGFFHEERVERGGPTATWMQIFVRPRSAGLPPLVQMRDRPQGVLDGFRLLAGNETSGAPCTIRNDVSVFDAKLSSGSRAMLPTYPGWDSYVHVLKGAVDVGTTDLSDREGVLLQNGTGCQVHAKSDAILLVFLVNRVAEITHAGTISR